MVTDIREVAEILMKTAYGSIPITLISNREAYVALTGRKYFKPKPWEDVEEKLREIAKNPDVLPGYVFFPYPPILTDRWTVFFYKEQETKPSAYSRVFGGFRIRVNRKEVE